MDVAKGSAFEPMLTTAALAAMRDFPLGRATVSPSTRTITGPGGHVDVEPRVMQVLVALAEAAGRVVTRDALFSRCWGGVYVGDDSLNRTIAVVRKLASDIAEGSFEVETIPRTGYRLNVTGAVVDARRGLSRRLLIGGGAASLVLVGGVGIRSVLSDRADRRFEALLAAGEEAFSGRSEMSDEELVATFERAVALRPDSARAWGWLGYAKAALAEQAPPEQAASLARDAQRAVTKALAIDPRQPQALIALADMKGAAEGWARYDQRLRQVLAIDPRNIRALSTLSVLLQAAGLNRESWDINEHILALDPLSTVHLTRRALKLWILGRTAQADQAIDRVRDLWPTDDWAFYVRFQLFALTGRPRAAMAMIDGNEARLGPPAAVAVSRAALTALDEPTAAHIAAARAAIVQAATRSPGLAAQGVMILAALKEVDAAFDVANGFLLSRGSVVMREQKGPRQGVNDPGWKWTPWLFTPPAGIMRSDPRFLPLCAGVGLTDYWRARGVRPDYQIA